MLFRSMHNNNNWTYYARYTAKDPELLKSLLQHKVCQHWTAQFQERKTYVKLKHRRLQYSIDLSAFVRKFTSLLCLMLQEESQAQLARIYKQQSLQPPQAALAKVNTKENQLDAKV